MQQPDIILKSGTKVITHKTLEDTKGMLISKSHLDARKTDALGIIDGVVGGHGGDVYWVLHEGSSDAAAYIFTEFELA